MSDKPQPSYAPVYAAALYPDLAVLFRKHGYALAVHGSLQRDIDLIAVAWAAAISDPAVVISELTNQFDIQVIGNPVMKNHGRIAWTLSIGFGQCAIDLSFLPTPIT